MAAVAYGRNRAGLSRLKEGSLVSALFCGGLALVLLLAVFEFLVKVVWPDPLIYTWITEGL